MQSHGYNNDGCDPESCNNVLIEDCDLIQVMIVLLLNQGAMKMGAFGISQVRI